MKIIVFLPLNCRIEDRKVKGLMHQKKQVQGFIPVLSFCMFHGQEKSEEETQKRGSVFSAAMGPTLYVALYKSYPFSEVGL